MKYIKRIKPFSSDKRGHLSYLADKKYPISDALFIYSKKGAVRANHYHKKDVHSIYIVSGEIKYIFRDMRKPNSQATTFIVKAGEMVTSPPMIAHKVIALQNTLMIVLTTESREQSRYERDTVRLEVENNK